MAGQARHMRSYSEVPVSSASRRNNVAHIPPFEFVGLLTTSVSGSWPIPSYIELTEMSVTAVAAGVIDATLFLAKKMPLEEKPTVLGSVVLRAESLKGIANLRADGIDKLVSPYDELFVVTFSESLHKDVVVQPLGVYR